MISLRQMQYLKAVMETLHFGQAAKKCFVTQSTLSAGIKEMEEFLGVTLIERNNRKVLPTPIGKLINTQATEILSLTSDLIESSKTSQEPMSGRITLGIIPTIGSFLLTKTLLPIREKFPKLELYLLEEQSSVLIKKLETAEIDMAILAFPYDIGELESRIFFGENFYLASSIHHPFNQRKTLKAKDIDPQELLLMAEGHCLREHVLSVCNLTDVRHNNKFAGTSLYTIMQMVGAGQGIAFLPEIAADTNLVDFNNIKLTKLAEPGPHRQFGFIWRRSFHNKAAALMLADFMQKHLAK